MTNKKKIELKKMFKKITTILKHMSLYSKTKEETDAAFADNMLDKIRDLLVDHNTKTGSNIPI